MTGIDKLRNLLRPMACFAPTGIEDYSGPAMDLLCNRVQICWALTNPPAHVFG